MTNLPFLTLIDALKGLRSKEFTAQELTEQCINRMEQCRPLNAYITETAEQALAQAKEADARIHAGTARPLDGIPIATKDNFCTKGVRTTVASKMLANFVPPYESTITGRLAAAGAISIGKTNMDDSAMGSSNATSFFGPAISPWRANNNDADLTPGGSSGGSAAAVAGHTVFMALGSDTGGSIRQPAAFTGTVGVKPTYGRCSRYGLIAFASSLDQPGVLTRSVADAALTLQAMMGHDPKDATSSIEPIPDLSVGLTKSVRGLRVGIPTEYRHAMLAPEIAALWDKTAAALQAEGAELVEVSLPHTDYALACYYIIAPAEASSNLARYDGVRYGHRAEGVFTDVQELYKQTRRQGFGDEVRRRIMIGTYLLSSGYYDAYYSKAQRVRTLIMRDFDEAFAKVDVLLTPTTPTAAFPIGAHMNDPVAMYLNDLFTIPASMAGLPAMALPVGLSSERLPLGMQLIGRRYDEVTMLQVGYCLERLVEFSASPVYP